MHLKAWFVAAFALAFLAGGGAGLVANRLLGPEPKAPRGADVDGWLRVFEEQIGALDREQERAVRSYYESYIHDVDRLTQDLIATRQERFQEVRLAFIRRVGQQLDGANRTRWQEKTGTVLDSGPSDPDAGQEETPEDAEGPGGK